LRSGCKKLPPDSNSFSPFSMSNHDDNTESDVGKTIFIIVAFVVGAIAALLLMAVFKG